MRGSDTQSRLKKAASELFAIHGYEGTRVRDVVRVAGTNLASVNYYFGGKEGLYAATVSALAERRSLAQRADAHVELDPALQLFHLIHGAVGRILALEPDSQLSRILAHELMKPTAHFDSLVKALVGPDLERLRVLVQRLSPRPMDSDSQTALALSIMAQYLFLLLGRGAVERLHPGLLDIRRTREIARRITGFALSAISAPSLVAEPY